MREPLKDYHSARFDIVLSALAVHYVEKLEPVFAEFYRLLKPGGLLFVLEGHPLNWVWRGGAPRHELDPGRGGYFDSSSRVNSDFPASAVRRHARVGETLPEARERQWNLGHVVTALAQAGLIVERLDELPAHYWPQFPDIPSKELALLPHSYLLSARAAAPVQA